MYLGAEIPIFSKAVLIWHNKRSTVSDQTGPIGKYHHWQFFCFFLNIQNVAMSQRAVSASCSHKTAQSAWKLVQMKKSAACLYDDDNKWKRYYGGMIWKELLVPLLSQAAFLRRKRQVGGGGEEGTLIYHCRELYKIKSVYRLFNLVKNSCC